MGISPPTDIVLDVMRAADPERVRAARSALAARAAGAPPGDDAGAATAADAGRGHVFGLGPLKPGPSPTRPASAGPPPAPVAAPDDPSAIFTDFEAVTLTTFVKAMLPREADSIYGGGLAGGIFRDMYAAEIASEIARAGGVGVAERLAAHYGRGGDGAPPADPATPGAGRAA